MDKPQLKSFEDVLPSDSYASIFPALKASTHRVVPFEFSLVRKFLLHRPSLDVIQKIFFALKLLGEFSLFNDLDYSKIFFSWLLLCEQLLYEVNQMVPLLILERNLRWFSFGFLSQISVLIYSLIVFYLVWVSSLVVHFRQIMPMLWNRDPL
ncbi:hypothetical protein IEQ34_002919 [Dendrobium chrysotoxum]|uniref:Uncharacterized protein n=1 Tax=Dendrobium chrysotoxum TaxID=161865 RepID=A0AAV7HH65_DENCH|nr:hypothetical protein IEQ34_002919 [Dendrobium chrysotoxum]